MKSTIRADKLLSSLGVTSRRNIGNFLRKNKVFSNNRQLHEPGDRILASSVIKINGKVLRKPGLVYFAINKPKGYISTAKDEFGRKNVLSLVKTNERIFPIGRLDKDTHGLLLLTNDGDLTNKLIHPKFHVEKVYELVISGNVDKSKLTKIENGIDLEDGITAPAKVSVLFVDGKKTTLRLTIQEGKKRQIRRMCERIKLTLVDLKRTEFGPIKLGNLKLGETRTLTGKEIKILKSY